MTSPRQNAPQAVGPLDLLNDPGEVFRGPDQVAFVRRLIELLKAGFASCLSRDRAAPDFLLQSPAGKVYRVSVGEDGAMVTTYVRG